jgi:predicted NACHT family NTPase
MTTTFEPDETQFQKYFTSISQQYGCWGNFYTLTDSIDRQSQDKAGFSNFDFGLMVERVVPKQDKQEKRDRLPVLEGIRKYLAESKHVLLIGKPGSGKSTTLQKLLWEEARAIIQGEKRKIPVLIELRRWDTSLETLIYKVLRSHKYRVDKEKIEDLLFDGELLLLMDGLNELPSDEARDKVAVFRQDYPDTGMVFTTRDLAIGGNLGIDEQLELQPLSVNQIQNFIRNYFPDRGENLLRQLENRLRELGENPFILKMLCDVFESSGEIPRNKGELFRKFDSKVNNFKENQESVPIPEGLRSKKKELLSYLAFEMMRSENPQADLVDFRLSISYDQTEAILEKFLTGKTEYPWEKAKYWLKGLLKHCLLESVTSELDRVTIQFHHQLFQEYYAAEYLLRLLPSLSDRKLKRDYLNLLKWTESIAIALALVDNEAQAVWVVQLALDVDLMLGSRLAGEVKQEFQEKTVEFILKLDIREKLRVEFLGLTRSKFVTDTLIVVLNNGSPSDRSLTIDALEKIGGDRVIDTLIIALNNEDAFARITALQALGNIGNNKAVIPIISLLNDEHAWVRITAVQVLGVIGDKIAVNFLTCSLNDEDSDVRYFAQDSLTKLKNIKSIVSFKNKQDYYLAKPQLNDEDFEIIYNPETEEDEIILIEKYLPKNYSYDSQEFEYFTTLFKGKHRYFTSDYSDQVRLLKNNASSAIICRLWEVLLSEVNEAKDIILRIQERCKFYNHEIFHSPPVEDETENKYQPIINNFHGEVGIVNTGKVEIHGNQIGLEYYNK